MQIDDFLAHPGGCGRRNPRPRQSRRRRQADLSRPSSALPTRSTLPTTIRSTFSTCMASIGSASGDSSMLRDSICTELKLCAGERLEKCGRGVCRQRRVLNHRAAADACVPGQPGVEQPRRSGKRQRRLSCTGSCTSKVIPQFSCWMRSTGGRWLWRSNAATS